jgi:ribonuclease HI
MTSARRLPGGRAGITVVLRWQTTGETRTLARRLRRYEPARSSYRAVLQGLWEARKMGARRIVLSTDDAAVAAQLTGTDGPPAGTIGFYLQARAMCNAFRSAEVRQAEPGQLPAAWEAGVAAEHGSTPGLASHADLPLWAAS